MTVAATMIQNLKDPDKNVRIQAVIALGTIGGVDALEALVTALATETDFFVRESITWALVRVGESAVSPMIEMLEHAEPEVRLSAIHTLGKLGDPRAVPALMDTLANDDGLIRERIVFVLGQLGPQEALPALVKLLGEDGVESSTILMSAIENFGVDAFDVLISRLQDSDWHVRAQIVDLLGFMSSPITVPHLGRALTDEQPQVRIKAVIALASVVWDSEISVPNENSRQVVDAALRGALNDDDRRVRLLAERVLADRE